jgi:hypothetical protein
LRSSDHFPRREFHLFRSSASCLGGLIAPLAWALAIFAGPAAHGQVYYPGQTLTITGSALYVENVTADSSGDLFYANGYDFGNTANLYVGQINASALGSGSGQVSASTKYSFNTPALVPYGVAVGNNNVYASSLQAGVVQQLSGAGAGASCTISQNPSLPPLAFNPSTNTIFAGSTIGDAYTVYMYNGASGSPIGEANFDLSGDLNGTEGASLNGIAVGANGTLLAAEVSNNYNGYGQYIGTSGQVAVIANAPTMYNYYYPETSIFGAGLLVDPVAIATNPTNHNIYVLDSGLHSVVEFNTSGSTVARFSAPSSATSLAVDGSGDVTLSSLTGTLYRYLPGASIEATFSNQTIISGGSASMPLTVTNNAPAGSPILSYSVSANVSGTGFSTLVTPAPQGLTVNQSATHSVSILQNNSPPTTPGLYNVGVTLSGNANTVNLGASLTVLDHASPGFATPSASGATLDGGTLDFNFGTVTAGNAPITFSYQIQNAAAAYRAALDYASSAAIGQPSGAFSVSFPSSIANLAPGGTSVAYNVTLNPSTAGSFSDEYELNFTDHGNYSGASQTAPLYLEMTGNVLVQPAISASLNSGKVVTGAASVLAGAIQDTVAGTVLSYSASATVTNTSGITTTVVSSSGIVSGPNSVVNTVYLNGGSLTTPGIYNVQLNVSGNAPSVATTATLTVLDHSLGEFANGSTTLNLDFGSVLQNSSSPNLTYQIMNAPGVRAALEATAWNDDSDSVVELTQGVFTTFEPSNNNLRYYRLSAGSSSSALPVRFNTTNVGSYSGQFTLDFIDESDLAGGGGSQSEQTLTLNVFGKVSANTVTSSGGTSSTGGVQAVFTGSTSTSGTQTGSFTTTYTNTASSLAAVIGSAAASSAGQFALPGGNVQAWDVEFDGTATGTINLTFSYDPTLLGSDYAQLASLGDYAGIEASLEIQHYTDGAWETPLPQSVIYDPTDGVYTITVPVTSFSPFLLTEINPVPEPSAVALLGAGAVGLLGWGWRRHGPMARRRQRQGARDSVGTSKNASYR